ncbi:hypothetical protein [Photobacterium damselae]|uniref:hypothetical protein n=1 Tax=Photobacterium damselae TaxID=38293 RepID=UPI001F44D19B|nr:hypothetical protein [Photobacterium damselae]UKA04791.1 hypothetical protein IHC89_21350 [Photobacterium damselae subsp. damselae]
MALLFENLSQQVKGKFPLKLGAGVFYTDSNFQPVKMNAQEVNRLVKRLKKESIIRDKLTKFRNEVTVKNIDNKYWAISHLVV